MNYGTLQERTRVSIGAVKGELDTEIEGFCFQSIEDIHGERRWPWNLKSGTFLARGRLTGTATWTLGQDTVVLNTGGAATGELAEEFKNGLIQLTTNIYVITNYDILTQTITTATEIIDASGAAVTYTLVQDMNTLPPIVESVHSVKDFLDQRPLRMIDGNARRRLWPNPFLALGGQPREAWVRGVDENGNNELGLYPPPTNDRVYFFEYWRGVVLPVKDTDELEAVTGIPVRYHSIILARSKQYAYEHERENDVFLARTTGEYQRGLSKMRRHRGAHQGVVRQVHHDRGATHPIFRDNPDIREP